MLSTGGSWVLSSPLLLVSWKHHSLPSSSSSGAQEPAASRVLPRSSSLFSCLLSCFSGRGLQVDCSLFIPLRVWGILEFVLWCLPCSVRLPAVISQLPLCPLPSLLSSGDSTLLYLLARFPLLFPWPHQARDPSEHPLIPAPGNPPGWGQTTSTDQSWPTA